MFYVIGQVQHMVSDDVVGVAETVRAPSWEEASLKAANEAMRKAGKGGAHWPYADHEQFGEDDWSYWLMAVVELAPGLPVRYAGNETYMPEVDEAAAYATGPRTVVVALDEESGATFVQRLNVVDFDEVLPAVGQLMGDPDTIHGFYGAIMEEPDNSFVVVDPHAMLQEINRYRQRVGEHPLDPHAAQWSDADVIREALRIRSLNPKRGAVKDILLSWT